MKELGGRKKNSISFRCLVLTDDECTETIVYAQINIENGLRKTLLEKDFKRLESIVYQYEHLKQNIRKIEFEQYRTGSNYDQTFFHHTLPVKLFVDSSRLWENPRSLCMEILGPE